MVLLYHPLGGISRGYKKKHAQKTKLNFVQNAQNAENERKPEAAAGADRGIGPRRNRRKGDKREP
jgi:hypothetical protein